MIKARVDISGLAKAMNAQLPEIYAAIDANLSATADVVFQNAKTTAAFNDLTGNLRRSIKKRKSRFENGGYIVYASGKNQSAYAKGRQDAGGYSTTKGEGSKGFHAHLVEFGHVLIAWGKVTGRKTRGRFFMRTAKEHGIKTALALFRSRR